MIESIIVNEWKAEGERRAKVDILFRVFKKLPGAVPEKLTQAIRDCRDLARLDAWLDAALEASNLDDFRRVTDL